MAAPPLLSVTGLGKSFRSRAACSGISFELWPGEVLGIVGESGSGKSTLLKCLSGQLAPSGGSALYRRSDGRVFDLAAFEAAEKWPEIGAEIGFVHQNPVDGLRLNVSAGANIGEPMMVAGARRYDSIRGRALDWLRRVEIDADRIDDCPPTFSGGMQQRLQLARALVTEPRLVLMDEPTGGLDVSVQAKILDLLRRLVTDLGLAVLLVTHDIGVARLLAHRLLVLQGGRVVETGLTDQVLDDPHHPYTQLLISSVLAA